MQILTTGNVPVKIKDDNVEVRLTEFGEMTVSFIRLAEGTALEDCAYVYFSPTKEFDPIIRHIQAGPA